MAATIEKTTDFSKPQTDYSRWRMKSDHGRQTWHYLESDEENEKWPQTTADKWFLGLPTVQDTSICIVIWLADRYRILLSFQNQKPLSTL